MTDETVQLEDSNLEEVDGTLDHQEESIDENNTEDVAEKLTKAEELARNQKIRAEKAEKELKRLKALPKIEPARSVDSSMSVKDIVALRDIHEEDVDYLLDEAKLRGKAVSELKKDPYMQIVLKARAEERNTAEATNTGKAKRSNNSLSHEQIVSLANEGREVDPVKLAEANMALRLKRIQ